MSRTFSKLDAKVALVASTLFNGFYSIPKDATKGKRIRKKILRALKLRLNLLRAKSDKEYLELMYMMPGVSKEALDQVDGPDKILVQPKSLMTRLRDTMPEVYAELGMPGNLIEDLNTVYEHEHALASIKYINRLKVVVNREAWKWMKEESC